MNKRKVEVNERNVGKLYRQFLALLGATSEQSQKKLAETVEKHGGVIFGLDGLQPEGSGSLLYVLYEVLSGTAVGALQVEKASAERLAEWMQAYQKYPVLGVSDRLGRRRYVDRSVEEDMDRCPTSALPGALSRQCGRSCSEL